MVHDLDTAMEQLAAELRDRGLETNLILAPGGLPRMIVRNPAATALSETIVGHAGGFWWPWKDRIGPASDVPGVAGVIARVLATADAVHAKQRPG